MHLARMGHSSCQLAAHIYVFCGMISLGNSIHSVEKLSIDSDPNIQVSKRWELIPDASLTALPALYAHMSVPLNDSEIVILGGYGQSKGNVLLYDTITDSCSSIQVQGAFEFYNDLNGNYPIA